MKVTVGLLQGLLYGSQGHGLSLGSLKPETLLSLDKRMEKSRSRTRLPMLVGFGKYGCAGGLGFIGFQPKSLLLISVVWHCGDRGCSKLR